MIFYHGSDQKFDKFDIKYAKDGMMYCTPCKILSQSYAVGRTGQGYIYHIEISSDEHLNNSAPETGCGCKAYISVEHWNIIEIEPSSYHAGMKPVIQAECGRIIVIPSGARTKHLRPQRNE